MNESKINSEMKRAILTIIVMLIFQQLQAFSPDSLMKSANEAYGNKKYQKAIEQYEQLLNEGYESAVLYYNLGNAYYKTANLPGAILNYERAKKIAPRDEDIQYNLDMANAMVVDKIEKIPDFFLRRWFKAAIQWLSTNTWAWISAVSFLFVLLLAALFLFTDVFWLKKTAFVLAILFFILSGWSFYASYKQKQKMEAVSAAVVFEPSVTVVSSPSEGGTELFVLHEGTKVLVETIRDDWYEIKLQDGSKGWLPKASVKVI